MPTKLGKRKVSIPQEGKQSAVLLDAFENYSSLAAFTEINLKGRSVGAALLQRGKNKFCFVFGFTTPGIHDTLKPEQLKPTVESLEAALKELLPGERMTVHLSSSCEDSDRQQELMNLVEKAPSTELQLLLMSERARAMELRSASIRRPKTLTIYVTYTVEFDQRTNNDSDWIEKVLAKGLGVWETFKGNKEEVERKQFEKMIVNAFNEGYMRWEHLLNIKMGLDLVVMSAQQIWERLWKRFNFSNAPKVPQLMYLDENGLKELLHTEEAPTTVLIAGENGRSTVPEADRRWVRVKGKYVGALTFSAKPGGFSNRGSQLRYLWEVLCRPHVFDTEVICQVSSANRNIVKTNVQRVLKQSNVAAQYAQDNKSIDVAAQVKTKRSVAAQEKLFEGAVPIHVGIVFLVHRNTIGELDEACSVLSECFQLPAKVIRENEITWQYWLQSHIFSWDKMLARPYARHFTYLTNEAPGLIPLTMTRPGSNRGFELIADKGGSPVKIDLVRELRNMAVFGTTRSGKSVLVSGILTEALAEGLPIVALDYPKPDGTSTFSDYAAFLSPRAAYFDIGKESNNLMEMPDLRDLSEELQKERFEDYRSFLESAIVTMVLPNAQNDPMLEQTVRSLIGRALIAYFKDPKIQARYNAAQEMGFGTAAWGNTPTLKDFLGFCTVEKLGIADGSQLIRNAQSQIELQIDYWLNSRVGKAIALPSSFPTGAQLLVFALRNLNNENEAAVLSLSAYSAALRRALESPRSLFFIDESPILFAFDTIARLIGRLCANGSKSGIGVILSAQDPDTIMNSVAGKQIFANINTRLIGRIQPMASESFVELLRYERSIVSRNSTEAFFPKRSELYSNWLVDIDGIYTYCRYYPGPIQLSVVANNPDEQAARARVMAQYQNKFQGIAEFGKQYFAAVRSGAPMSKIGAGSPADETQKEDIYAA